MWRRRAKPDPAQDEFDSLSCKLEFAELTLRYLSTFPPKSKHGRPYQGTLALQQGKIFKPILLFKLKGDDPRKRQLV